MTGDSISTEGVRKDGEAIAGAFLGTALIWLGLLAMNWVNNNWTCGGPSTTCLAILPLVPLVVVVGGIATVFVSVFRWSE